MSTYDWHFAGARERMAENGPALLAGLSPDALPTYAENLVHSVRLRDIWIENHNGTAVIAVYTRTGGHNREDYQEQIDLLRSHPGYREDADDTYDETYARFLFTSVVDPGHGIVDDFEDITASLLARAVPPVDTGARWRDTIALFEQAANDGLLTPPPQLTAAFEALKRDIDQHIEHLDRLHLLRRRRKIASPVLERHYHPVPTVCVITT